MTGAILGSVDVLFNLPFLRRRQNSPKPPSRRNREEENPNCPHTHPSFEPHCTPPDADIFAPFETNEVLDGDSPVNDEGKFQGIYQPGTGGNYIAMGDSFYLVSYSNELKTWIIIDPVNPYSFYRNIPVRLDEMGEWVPLTRPGLVGGGLALFADLFARAEPPLPDFDAPATASMFRRTSSQPLNRQPRVWPLREI